MKHNLYALAIAIATCLTLSACQSESSEYTTALPDDAAALAVFSPERLTSEFGESILSILDNDQKELVALYDNSHRAYIFARPDGICGVLCAIKDVDEFTRYFAEKYDITFTEQRGLKWGRLTDAIACIDGSNRMLLLKTDDEDTAHRVGCELMGKNTSPTKMLAKVNSRRAMLVAYGDGAAIGSLAKSSPLKRLNIPINPSDFCVLLTLEIDGNQADIEATLESDDPTRVAELVRKTDDGVALLQQFMPNILKVNGRTIEINVADVASMAGRREGAALLEHFSTLTISYDETGRYAIRQVANKPYRELIKELK